MSVEFNLNKTIKLLMGGIVKPSYMIICFVSFILLNEKNAIWI